MALGSLAWQPATATPGCPDADACIAVYVNNATTPQWVGAQQISAGDITSVTDYDVRTANGPCDSDNPVGPGTSINDLLTNDVPGIDPDDVNHVSVLRADGAPIVLYTAELGTGASEYYNDQVPVFWSDGSDQLEFLRGLLAVPNPCPASGPAAAGADSNASDQILPTSLITIDVNDGPDLVVDASTTTAAPKPGHASVLTATVQDPAPGVTYHYSWDFGDGDSSPPSRFGRVSHVYTSGVWPARVTVTGSDASDGFAQVLVTGPAVTRHGSKPKPGTTNPPRHRGHQSSTPRTRATRSKQRPSSGRGTAADTTPMTSTSTTKPPRASGTATRVRLDPTATKRASTARPARQTSSVSGELLAEDHSVPRSSPVTSDANQLGVAAVATSSGWSVTLGLLAAAAMVATGAIREMRSRSPFRPRSRRR